MIKSKKDKLREELVKEELNELEELTSGGKSSETEAKSEEGTKENDKTGEVGILKDQLLRKAAEFENYKRRIDNEISSLYKYASENLISDLLPVLDDFERVFAAWNEKHNAETFKKGVELIYEKFKGILEKQGLKEMDSDGKPFDVNLHDALMQVPDGKTPPNTIINTVEKGYYLKDKVIRHAKVLVSSNTETEEEDKES